MAQIGINTLHGEGVIFVVNIEDLPRGKSSRRASGAAENFPVIFKDKSS